MKGEEFNAREIGFMAEGGWKVIFKKSVVGGKGGSSAILCWVGEGRGEGEGRGRKTVYFLFGGAVNLRGG
jgi:hypothetical protein